MRFFKHIIWENYFGYRPYTRQLESTNPDSLIELHPIYYLYGIISIKILFIFSFYE